MKTRIVLRWPPGIGKCEVFKSPIRVVLQYIPVAVNVFKLDSLQKASNLALLVPKVQKKQVACTRSQYKLIVESNPDPREHVRSQHCSPQ